MDNTEPIWKKKPKRYHVRGIDLKRDQEIDDMRAVLETPSGVRLIQRLIGSGRVFCSTYTGNSNTYFLEGKRSLSLEILEDVVLASPEKLFDVMYEEETE